MQVHRKLAVSPVISIYRDNISTVIFYRLSLSATNKLINRLSLSLYGLFL